VHRHRVSLALSITAVTCPTSRSRLCSLPPRVLEQANSNRMTTAPSPAVVFATLIARARARACIRARANELLLQEGNCHRRR